MMTSSNRNIFRITGPLWGEFTSHRWHGALMFSLIYAWTHDWVNNRDTFDVRRHHAHDDVSVMIVKYSKCWWPGDTKRVDTRRVSILMHEIKWLSRQIVLFFFHKNICILIQISLRFHLSGSVDIRVLKCVNETYSPENDSKFHELQFFMFMMQ